MEKGNFLELKTALETKRKIVIVSHKSPDGDAMGSSLAVYHLLKKKGHEVQVIVPNEDPSFLKWMPGRDHVLVFEYDEMISSQKIAAADYIFCLDFNTLGRIEKMGDLLAASPAEKIMIDHHQEPDDFANYMISDTTACSTAQLIYRFMQMLDYTSLLDANIASCIYTGIVTDTGSFRFDSVTAETHQIVAELIEAGAKNSDIHSNLFDNNSESRLRLLGYCLSEKMRLFSEFKTAVISLTVEEKQRFGFQKGDTEGFVNYPLSMGDIKMSIFLIEYDHGIKMSFRSKGSFSVNRFAREHFDGGGHNNAAGGHSSESQEAIIAKLLEVLPNYKKALWEDE